MFCRPDVEYICKWSDCGLKFRTLHELTKHVTFDHIEDFVVNKKLFVCPWKDCSEKPFTKDDMFMGHVMYCHVFLMALDHTREAFQVAPQQNTLQLKAALQNPQEILERQDSEIRHEVLQTEDTHIMNNEEEDDVANTSNRSSSSTNSSSICIIDTTEYENETDDVLPELQGKPKPSEIHFSDAIGADPGIFPTELTTVEGRTTKPAGNPGKTNMEECFCFKHTFSPLSSFFGENFEKSSNIEYLKQNLPPVPPLFGENFEKSRNMEECFKHTFPPLPPFGENFKKSRNQQEIDSHLSEMSNPRYFHTESSVSSHKENETTNVPFFSVEPLPFEYFYGLQQCGAPVTTCENGKHENVLYFKHIVAPLQIPTEPFAVSPPSPLITHLSNTTSSRKDESRGVKRNTSRSLEDDVNEPLEVKAERDKERGHDNNAKERISVKEVTETVKEPVRSSGMFYSKTDKPPSTKSNILNQAVEVITNLENLVRENFPKNFPRSLFQSPDEETIDEEISVENDMQKDNTNSQNRVGYKKRGKKNDSIHDSHSYLSTAMSVFLIVNIIGFLIIFFLISSNNYNLKKVHDVSKNEIMERFSRVHLLIDILQKKVDKMERAQVKNAEDISFIEPNNEERTSENKTKKDINFLFWKVTVLRKHLQWIGLGISAIIIAVICNVKPYKYLILGGVIGLIAGLCNHFLDVKMSQ